MLKRILAVAVVATAISVPAIAGAATTHKTVKKSRSVSLAVKLTNLSPPGAIVSSGAQTFTGSVDGSVGGTTVHGALRGVNTYTGLTFSGTVTVFAPKGTATALTTGAATVNSTTGAITFTGTLKLKSGTGAYKGITGTLPFTGSTTNKDADGDNDAVAAGFTISGKAKY